MGVTEDVWNMSVGLPSAENCSIITACYDVYATLFPKVVNPIVMNPVGFLLENNFGPPQMPPRDSKWSSNKVENWALYFLLEEDKHDCNNLNVYIYYFYKIDL